MTTTSLETSLISKAQTEVWEWKRAAWKEVDHLDIHKAFLKRLKDSSETCRFLGFCPDDNEK